MAGGRGGGGAGGQMAKEGAEVWYVGLSKCGVRHYDDVLCSSVGDVTFVA